MEDFTTFIQASEGNMNYVFINSLTMYSSIIKPSIYNCGIKLMS